MPPGRHAVQVPIPVPGTSPWSLQALHKRIEHVAALTWPTPPSTNLYLDRGGERWLYGDQLCVHLRIVLLAASGEAVLHALNTHCSSPHRAWQLMPDDGARSSPPPLALHGREDWSDPTVLERAHSVVLWGSRA